MTHSVRPAVHGGDPDVTESATGEVAGGLLSPVAHEREGFDVRCEGAVNVDPDQAGRPIWSLTGSLEAGDLTLSPSILCRLGTVSGQACGFHGWIRAGRWVAA